MKVRARFLLELMVIVSAVGCLSAIVSEPRGASRLPSTKIPTGAIAIQSTSASEEGPLIPQISRPIFRFAPVEYRDAFSPVLAPRGRYRCGPRLMSTGHCIRDPFHSPTVRAAPRVRVISAAQPAELVHFRS